MKVYVITKGEYSDYHICAVTLDPEHAERLKTIFTTEWDGARVEEFDTDAPVDLLSGKKPYRVNFKENGDFLKCVEADPIMVVGDVPIGEWPGSRELIVYVAADDPAAAIKIAAEKRAKYLAEKAGIA